MRLKWDKQYLKYSLYGFMTVALSIMFYLLLNNVGYLFSFLSLSFEVLRKLLNPFIIGASIAYLLNPGVRWFERKLYGRVTFINQHKKLRRLISILSMYLILISGITLLIVFVAPQITNNIRDIINNVDNYYTFTTELLNRWVEDIEAFSSYNVSELIDSRLNELFQNAEQILVYVLNNLINSVVSITFGLLNFVLGLIVSFYLIMDKESFKIGIEKILRVIWRDGTVEKVKVFGREVDTLFAKFIVGKSIDSFIIACICYVGLKFMGIRYALLLSLIVGVTNMIPYFGPFIGAVPAVIITFFDSPLKALWILIFILVLQQFDGLILGPKILGDSVGVTPFWIVFSIVVGGKLFGILGMFLGVPVIAILRLVINRFIDRQLEIKDKKKSLEENNIST